MRSSIRAMAIALGVTAVSAGVTKAQQAPLKIAYINSQVLLDAAPGRAQAESLLMKEGEGFRTQLQKMQDSVNNLYAKYQKDEPTLTASKKEDRQKAIQSLETDLQATQLKFQQQFEQRKNEVMAPITDVVKKVIDDVREEGGYAMILDNAPGASVIVSADKNLDITDRVVSRLRATAKPTLPTAASPKPGAPASPAGVTKPIKPPTQ
jgi:outer membrane protein